jgi:ankyrin repeat protein
MNIVRMLLNAGANPYIANYAGLTPLAIAQRANNIHAINLITNAIARKNTLQK